MDECLFHFLIKPVPVQKVIFFWVCVCVWVHFCLAGITKVPVIDPNPTQVISQGTVTPKQTPQSKQGSTGKSNQRYKSVKEVLREGSPIARRLFTEETGEGPSSVNLDRFLQRTGKVRITCERGSLLVITSGNFMCTCMYFCYNLC